MPKRAFISYARTDEAHAVALKDDLTTAGISCWFDTDDIAPGAKWKTQIEEAISNAEYFICLLSKRAVESRGYRHVEIHYAIQEARRRPPTEIFVIPVRIEKCEVPWQELRDIQLVDLFPDRHVAIEKIVGAIRASGAIDRPIAPHPSPGTTDPEQRPIETDSSYERYVYSCYLRYFCDVRRDSSLYYLCQQAGKVYRDIDQRNKQRSGCTLDEYDHVLAYYIAGWMIDHLDNHWLKDYSQQRLASTITDLIFMYLDHPNRPENIFDHERGRA